MSQLHPALPTFTIVKKPQIVPVLSRLSLQKCDRCTILQYHIARGGGKHEIQSRKAFLHLQPTVGQLTGNWNWGSGNIKKERKASSLCPLTPLLPPPPPPPGDRL